MRQEAIMEAIPGIGGSARTSPSPVDDANPLASLAAKVALGGDIASACMSLVSEDSSLQHAALERGIRIEAQEIREARKRRMEYLRKKWAASRKSGFWSRVASVFKGIAVAVTAVASVVCTAGVGTVVALAGTAAAGVPGLIGSGYARRAGRAAADQLAQEHLLQSAVGARDELVQSLEDLVQLEQRMHDRIAALADSTDPAVVRG
jgi:hypothetical protein